MAASKARTYGAIDTNAIQGADMPTLLIEHPITDFPTWLAAFGRFSDARRNAGARDERVHQPVGDPKHVVVEVDFDTVDEANAFLQFLETVVWANPDNAPALAGSPRALVLERATVSSLTE